MSRGQTWWRARVDDVRAAVLRTRTVGRVARSTGLVGSVRPGGVKALVKARGNASPSTMFRFHAGNQPLRTALVHGDRRYSYFELDERMDRIAVALRRAGIRRGDAVVLMLQNVPEFFIAQIGVGRLGAAAVSVSWRSTPEELAYLLDNSGARGIFFDASSAEVVRQVRDRFKGALGDRCYSVGGRVDGFAAVEDLFDEAPDRSGAALAEADAEEAAVVIYTSGTTGKPKGAVRKYEKDGSVPLLHFIERTPMRVGQTHLVVCPLYHSTAFGFASLSFVLGATVVLLDRFTPEGFLDGLERHRVNTTAVVPTMLHRTLALGPEALAARDTSHLEVIFTGGAPLTGPLAAAVMDALGDKLYNFYGATETGLVTLADPKDLRAAPGTIGRPIGGNELRLFDDEGRLAPAGEVGELYVRSGALVQGYHRNDDATRASMREGFFSVGDLARRDARGYYFIEGRKRDMVISGGVNVYPREVEAVLAAHPDVAEAAVIGVPDDEWGERVEAFVGLHEGASCDETALLTHCREKLAGPKRPRKIHFMPSLPRNPTGKVLKRQLRESIAGEAS